MLTGYPRRTPILIAFAAIYLIWGSTYLAIRVAVHSIPPLLMMALRCVLSGLLLLAFAHATSRRSDEKRARARIELRHWPDAFIVGALLFLLCHGSLAWAEQRVASSDAALLGATTPLWLTAIDWRWGARRRPRWQGVLGLAVGFAGVALLVGRGTSTAGHGDLVASLAIVFGALAWAAGSIYGRGARQPADVRVAAALQLVAGGVWLAAASVLAGEWHTVLAVRPTLASIGALAYLVVFGSVIAFAAYVWLLRVMPASIVGTHAYINPIVAVALGAALAGEPIAPATMAAALTIVVGVMLALADRYGAAIAGTPDVERAA
jgi:drug/metabolite transporter (DMT)-like permease